MTASPPRNEERKCTRSSPGHGQGRGMTKHRNPGCGGRGIMTEYDEDDDIAATSSFQEHIATFCNTPPTNNYYSVLRNPDDNEDYTIKHNAMEPEEETNNPSNHTRTSDFLLLSDQDNNSEQATTTTPTNTNHVAEPHLTASPPELMPITQIRDEAEPSSQPTTSASASQQGAGKIS
ncbi:hypothetical protein ACA910_012886 [Epithemia clementina (nom. ined.)]